MEVFNNVVNQFSGDLSIVEIGITLAFTLICSIIVCIVYKKTYCGVSYNKSYNLALILMPMVTAIAIKTVNANITLSLGMLGSLSIIRFRTAVKDITDTIYMFWVILVGIMCGAGLYIPAIIACVIIGIIYIICFMFNNYKKDKYLIVIKFNKTIVDTIKKLEDKKNVIFKNEMYNDDLAEFTISVKKKDNLDKIIELNSNIDVISISVMNLD